MNHNLALAAVQISARHTPTSGRSGLVGLAIVTIGLGFICYGLLPLAKTRIWREEAVRTQGWVADNVPRLSWRNKTTWLPLISFETEGTTVVFTGPPPVAGSDWPLGQRVDVLYARTNPQLARVAEAGQVISNWIFAGLAVVGLYFLAVLA